MIGYRVAVEIPESGISVGRATLSWILTYRIELDRTEAAIWPGAMTSYGKKHGGGVNDSFPRFICKLS